MNRMFAVALLLVLVATFACRKDGQDGAVSVERPTALGASVATVTLGSFVETVDAVGVVTVRPGRVAALSAPATTRVSRVFVSAGANVRAGQILVEFEQPPFQAAATSAEAALAAAESALKRAQRLVEAGVLPRRDAEVAAAGQIDLAEVHAVTPDCCVEHQSLIVAARIADPQLHGKSVQLSFWQWIRPVLVHRVLGRDHEE